MKRSYGSFVLRLAWGGTSLSDAEHEILAALVSALPMELKQVVEAQFDEYNLVQRESDGRALNFYRKKVGKVSNAVGLPLLKHQAREAPLVRITASVGANTDPLHAVLTAVDGRAFCITLNRKLDRREHSGPINVQSIIQAWRSNFELASNDA